MGKTKNAARIVRCWAQRWQSGGRAAAARLPAWTPEAAYLVPAGVLFFTSSRLACLAQFSEGEQGSANLEYLAASHFDRALLRQSIATQCEVLRGHLLEGGGCRRLCSSLLHGLPAYLDGPAVKGRMDFESPRPSLPGRAPGPRWALQRGPKMSLRRCRCPLDRQGSGRSSEVGASIL